MTDENLLVPAAAATDLRPRDMTLIRYVEVWTPSSDHRRLNLASACRLGKHKLLITPKSTAVAKGEGVAGRAWNQKSASIMQESPSELIEHYREVSGEPLVALVSIPIFHQTEMSGVAVLGLGPGYGAAELWSRDERDELSVSMSFYSGLKSLEFIHQYLRFPKGGGFPGKIWKSGVPQIAGDLGTSADVVSTFKHDEAAISAAIGVPIGSAGGFASGILMLLSAKRSPLAERIELWDCDSHTAREHDETPPATTIRINHIQTVTLVHTESGQPQDDVSDWRQQICDLVARQQTPHLIAKSAMQLPAGTEFVLILPVYRVRELVAILSLMF